MFRRLVSVMIPLVLLTTIMALAFNVQLAKAYNCDIYIRADGSIEPSSAPVSTLDNVTYTLSSSIDCYQYHAIEVERGNIIIDGAGYTIFNKGSGWPVGIYFSGVNNVTVKNITLNYFTYGVEIRSSANHSICNNEFVMCAYGIDIRAVSDTTISQNDFRGGYDIYLGGSSRDTISQNRITYPVGWGIWIESSSNNNIISDNEIANKVTGIRLQNSSHNIVSGNNISSSTQYGISLAVSANFNNITRNTITNTSQWAMPCTNELYGNRVYQNNITQNNNGIIFGNSYDTSIYENTIEDNEIYGIELANAYVACRNLVYQNNITRNGQGIYISGGHDSRIFHNNLVNNTVQTNVASTINFWDDGYPSGGNYLSNYTGTDQYFGPYQNETGSDGIGDAPHMLNSYNIDNYPLMNPWAPPSLAIVEIATNKNIVGQGYGLGINVTAVNKGNKIENMNITAYAEAIEIDAKEIILAGGNAAIFILTWNTSGFAKGNYTIGAYAWPPEGETFTCDNNFTDGFVIIAMPGDITGSPSGYPDGVVDMKDISTVAKLFGIDYPDTRYNPNCDIIYDLAIDMKDISFVARRFGQEDP